MLDSVPGPAKTQLSLGLLTFDFMQSAIWEELGAGGKEKLAKASLSIELAAKASDLLLGLVLGKVSKTFRI